MNYSNLLNMGNNQLQQKNPPINPEQFKTLVNQMSPLLLNQLIQQAKAQGISDLDIQQGINFIQSL